MTILGRTLVILSVALVIAGAALGIARVAGAEMQPAPAAFNVEAGQAGELTEFREPPEGREGGEPRGASVFGAVTLVKQLAIMGGIILAVAFVPRAWRKTRTEAHRSSPPAQTGT